MLPLLSRWVWLCRAPPSLGWGYSGSLLLLSSFSPAASRNAAVCAAAAALGTGGTRPLPSGCATPPVSLQTRCFISSRCTLSAPATSPQRETSPLPGTGCWGLPGLGKSPNDVQLKKKKQVRALFRGTNVARGGRHGGDPGRVWGPEQSFALEFGSGLEARVARAPVIRQSFAFIPASLTLLSVVGLLQAQGVQSPRVYQMPPESLVKPSPGSLSLGEQPSPSPNPSWDPLLLFAAN